MVVCKNLSIDKYLVSPVCYFFHNQLSLYNCFSNEWINYYFALFLSVWAESRAHHSEADLILH